MLIMIHFNNFLFLYRYKGGKPCGKGVEQARHLFRQMGLASVNESTEVVRPVAGESPQGGNPPARSQRKTNTWRNRRWCPSPSPRTDTPTVISESETRPVRQCSLRTLHGTTTGARKSENAAARNKRLPCICSLRPKSRSSCTGSLPCQTDSGSEPENKEAMREREKGLESMRMREKERKVLSVWGKKEKGRERQQRPREGGREQRQRKENEERAEVEGGRRRGQRQREEKGETM